jgi:hypothetical protein
VPPAPPRFSTMIAWPSRADSSSNTMRGITSVALPAPNGMIARMGFVGHVCAFPFGTAAMSTARPMRKLRSIECLLR